MKINKIGAKEDKSYSILKDLLNKGYDTIKFKAGIGSCEKCQLAESRNKNPMKIEEYLDTLSYEAPIAEMTHPDDSSCYFIVTKEDINEDDFEKIVYFLNKNYKNQVTTLLKNYIVDDLVDTTELFFDLTRNQIDTETKEFLFEKTKEFIEKNFPPKKVFYDGTIQNL